MNLYLISQTENNSYDNGYDTYSSAVVVAQNESIARQTDPETGESMDWTKNSWVAWCSKPSNVKIKLLGKADNSLKQGVVLSSFSPS